MVLMFISLDISQNAILYRFVLFIVNKKKSYWEEDGREVPSHVLDWLYFLNYEAAMLEKKIFLSLCTGE